MKNHYLHCPFSARSLTPPLLLSPSLFGGAAPSLVLWTSRSPLRDDRVLSHPLRSPLLPLLLMPSPSFPFFLRGDGLVGFGSLML